MLTAEQKKDLHINVFGLRTYENDNVECYKASAVLDVIERFILAKKNYLSNRDIRQLKKIQHNIEKQTECDLVDAELVQVQVEAFLETAEECTLSWKLLHEIAIGTECLIDGALCKLERIDTGGENLHPVYVFRCLWNGYIAKLSGEFDGAIVISKYKSKSEREAINK